MTLPIRKRNRLTGFDYSTQTAYFITIAAKDRKNIFWENAEAKVEVEDTLPRSLAGITVEHSISEINARYPFVCIDQYVIMPNHVHILLRIQKSEKDQIIPSVSTVVQQFKGYATKKAGFPLWQKSFHDHVVRGEKDYFKIREYIKNNPIQWKEDCYYQENESYHNN